MGLLYGLQDEPDSGRRPGRNQHSARTGDHVARWRGAAGQICQYNFLRMKDAATEIDAHFIQSDFHPTGLGEPVLPALMPAE